jgi:hypothetical protein
MIPAEWLDLYFKKSGDVEIRPTTYAHACEQGFATWEIGDGFILVNQMFGDGRFWEKFFLDMGKAIKLNIRFATRRNPKTWERKYNAKIVGYIMEVKHG